MTPNMKGITLLALRSLNLVLILITLLLALLLVMVRVDRIIKNHAVDSCAKVTKYEKEFASENAKITFPDVNAFKNCLKTKGY